MNKTIEQCKTAGEYASQHGIRLAQVKRVTGQSHQTLDNWFRNKPLMFHVAIVGTKEVLKANS